MATEEVLQQILAALEMFVPSCIQNILWDHFKAFLQRKEDISMKIKLHLLIWTLSPAEGGHLDPVPGVRISC